MNKTITILIDLAKKYGWDVACEEHLIQIVSPIKNLKFSTITLIERRPDDYLVSISTEKDFQYTSLAEAFEVFFTFEFSAK